MSAQPNVGGDDGGVECGGVARPDTDSISGAVEKREADFVVPQHIALLVRHGRDARQLNGVLDDAAPDLQQPMRSGVCKVAY
jgi:hypothetical protein